VHISQTTKDVVDGIIVESAHGRTRSPILEDHNIDTYIVTGFEEDEV